MNKIDQIIAVAKDAQDESSDSLRGIVKFTRVIDPYTIVPILEAYKKMHEALLYIQGSIGTRDHEKEVALDALSSASSALESMKV